MQNDSGAGKRIVNVLTAVKTLGMNNITFTREELYKLVWENPLNQIAVKYNISKSDIKKACITMKIPLPVSSYWRSFNLNSKPLPALADVFLETKSVEIPLNDKKNILRKSFNSGPDFDLAVRIINDPDFPLHLSDKLLNPCNVIYETRRNHIIRTSYGVFSNVKSLKLITAEDNFERVLIFLDALIKLLNFRGQKVEINPDGTGLFFLKDGISTEFYLREGCRKIFCKSSNRERTTEFTGQFIVKIKNENIQREWREVDILKESSLARIAAIIEFAGTETKRSFESVL
ncbi:hypothetical protein [Flavobacterium gelatinilyticum]|uniref:hypothetical protein n=1 Tax=Flavobacterium gelatinilyticum TaxID=3003260 RepID=UPI0024806311|nr:hypothetical protein [Flavobacterium gelatinilyticum]